MRTAPLALLTLASCGRFGFGAAGGADDAAPGDGPARDTAGDVPGDVAAPACLGSDIVCDLFDGPTISGWSMEGGASIDSAGPHRGAGSLHVHADAVPTNTDGYFGLFRTGVVPAAVGTLYLRAWVRLTSLPLNNMELFGFQQQIASNEDGLFVVPNAYSIYSQFEERSRDTGMVPALDTWTCLLWTIVRGNPGSLRLEGDVGPVQMSVQTDGTPPIDEIDVGIGFSGNTTSIAQPATDVWIDDLLVRDTPVTCAD